MTTDIMCVFIPTASAMVGTVTVVVTTSDDAQATDTVDHDDVSHTYTFMVEASAKPTAVGDMIVDTNARTWGFDERARGR